MGFTAWVPVQGCTSAFTLRSIIPMNILQSHVHIFSNHMFTYLWNDSYENPSCLICWFEPFQSSRHFLFKWYGCQFFWVCWYFISELDAEFCNFFSNCCYLYVCMYDFVRYIPRSIYHSSEDFILISLQYFDVSITGCTPQGYVHLYLTTHTTLTTDIHSPSCIRTHNPSKRAGVDLHLRPRGHWAGA